MSRDRLFLLQPGFIDPKHPEDRFVCPHGLPIEGLLASAPELAARLDITRVPFERPRRDVIAVLGEAHQDLPALVLGDHAPAPADAQAAGEVRFVTDSRRILELLAGRHGFAKVH